MRTLFRGCPKRGRWRRWLAPIAIGLSVAGAAASASLAAEDDSIRVERAVEVRVAPRPDAPVLRRLSRGQDAVERGRQGDWVEIEIPEAFVRGWVRAAAVSAAADRREPVAQRPARSVPSGRLARLLEPPPGAPGDQADRPSLGEPAAVERFRASVGYLAAQLAGKGTGEVLGEVRWADAGTVEVVVGSAWGGLSRTAQEELVERLFDRWLAAYDRPGQLRLELRDPDQRLVMSRSGP